MFLIHGYDVETASTIASLIDLHDQPATPRSRRTQIAEILRQLIDEPSSGEVLNRARVVRKRLVQRGLYVKPPTKYVRQDFRTRRPTRPTPWRTST